MYNNQFCSNELFSNPDEVVRKLVNSVKAWNVDHTVVEGLGIQEDEPDGFRMTYVPFGWKERLNGKDEKEIAKHDTIWIYWDPYPLAKTIFKNEKESLDKECVKKHIQEMIYELQKTIKERYVTKKKAEIILASEQFEI